MAKTDFKSVDDYIASQAQSIRPILQEVRAAIRAAAPDAKEVISYQMPAYKAPGGTLLYFAGWKQHWALYPISPDVAVAFREDLASNEITKGAIRFALDEPVPAGLIRRITQFRMGQVAAKAPTVQG